MTEPVRPPILGKHLYKALVKAGIADNMTRRVTIDVPVDGVVTVYREQLGDARMLDILPALREHGVEIVDIPNDPIPDYEDRSHISSGGEVPEPPENPGPSGFLKDPKEFGGE